MDSPYSTTLETRFHQALTQLQQGLLESARHTLQALLDEYPDCKEAWYQLAEIHQQQGALEQAVVAYTRVLEIDPAIQEVYNNLGVIASRQGLREMAKGYFAKALEINPNFVPVHSNLGQLFAAEKQTDLAHHHFNQALQQAPDLAKPYFEQSVLWMQQGQFEWALPLWMALADQGEPWTISALLKQAFCLQRLGRDSEALACLEQAWELEPDGAIGVSRACYLPVVYRYAQEPAQWRQRLLTRLSELEAQAAQLSFRRLHEMDWYPFYLAYQGENDRDIMRRLARLIEPHIPVPPAPILRNQGPVRIGWVSRYFHDHSVARCFLPLLMNFPKGCEHLIFRAPGSLHPLLEGPWQQRLAADIALDSHLALAQHQIHEQQLDILIFTDLGMDPFTWLLAQRRLAPLQYVLPGHPVTAGLDSVDGFISSFRLETAEAQSHYAEPLVLLDHPLVYFPHLSPPPVLDSAPANLPQGRLYACPVTLFKLHPQFDTVFSAILSQDPEAQILCFQDQHSGVSNHLRTRWQALCGAQAERIHLLPWLSAERFRQLLPLCAVILDPFPFGLGTTAYLALAAEVPIISWPGKFLRGRVVQALYQELGLTAWLADSLESYVQQALTLASDPEQRAQWKSKLQAGKALLFENSLGGQELAVFLQDALAQLRKKVHGV